MHCDDCGSEIKAGNKFCESCGQKMSEVTTKKRNLNFKPFLILFIVLVVAGVSAAYFTGFFAKIEPSSNNAEAKGAICNAPYILVGTDCCLDKDSNSICDRDEIQQQAPQVAENAPSSDISTSLLKEIPAIGTVRCHNNVPQRVELLVNGNKVWISGPTCGENAPCGIAEDGNAACIPKHQCEPLGKIECLSELNYRKCELGGGGWIWVEHTVPPKTGNVVYLCQDNTIKIVSPQKGSTLSPGFDLKVEFSSQAITCYYQVRDSGTVIWDRRMKPCRETITVEPNYCKTVGKDTCYVRVEAYAGDASSSAFDEAYYSIQ